jgi:hypothetical protein
VVGDLFVELLIEAGYTFHLAFNVVQSCPPSPFLLSMVEIRKQAERPGFLERELISNTSNVNFIRCLPVHEILEVSSCRKTES